jgi:DNA topoisomerase-1
VAADNLVIVESAAKARTIEKFLGPGYVVQASFGHVRDLPESKLGVDVDDDFAPQYVISKGKDEIVNRLKDRAKKADAIYLATDPDREGEAIAWHLVNALQLGRKTVRRIEFHEVTPSAIKLALQQPRAIDMSLVDAQQARRVLDRLVGYPLSELLWQKVRRGLSAGRVQSVAVRLVVDREREIQAFVPVEYWSLEAELSKHGLPRRAKAATFRAALVERDGEKIGLRDGVETQTAVADLEGAHYSILDIRKREQQRHPAAPFTTSTLQQEASRKLSFTAKRTMSVAQQLYEGIDLGGEQVGLITYMRTDSTNIAESALAEARDLIAQRFGKDQAPPSARLYKTRSRLAQEAHEGIRPTSVFREPEALLGRLSQEQYRLYELIWKRFVASQMISALFDVTTVDVSAKQAGHASYLFRASGSQLRVAGFLTLYREGLDEVDTSDESKQPLPELTVGEDLDLHRLIPEQHFTQPPPRYSEATLVKALEERGIGRPSTYAPTLSTIQDRGYVERSEKRLRPTDLGMLVNDLLVVHFPDVVDVDFTANMEERLDDVAKGERPWVPVVRDFYLPFREELERASREIRHVNEEAEITDETCDRCERPMAIKLGRFGKFLACTGYPECKGTRPLKGDEVPDEPTDLTCETCGKPMVIKAGRFGRFIACSGYPDCRTTRPIPVAGVVCPKCGSAIAERRSKRGRVFYGCTGYPACDWVSWSRPVPEPCPTCNGLQVQVAGNRLRCLTCEPEQPRAARNGAARANGDGDGATSTRRRAAPAIRSAARGTNGTAAQPSKSVKTTKSVKPAKTTKAVGKPAASNGRGRTSKVSTAAKTTRVVARATAPRKRAS